LIAADQAPITLGGSARHNIANALGAAATASVLGVPSAAIKLALKSFGRSIDDNPGRGNLVEIAGVKVLLDFAHNPDGMQVIFEAGQAMAAPRMAVIFGQAGDRTDDAIRDLTGKVVAAGPELVVIKEMAEYRRGREPGEIPAVIRSELIRLGIPEQNILYAETEIEASEQAFNWANPGDLLMLFVHSDRDAVLDRLRQIAQGKQTDRR
jgi:UDP-N-acetylmuramyl tripeptide synthase